MTFFDASLGILTLYLYLQIWALARYLKANHHIPMIAQQLRFTILDVEKKYVYSKILPNYFLSGYNYTTFNEFKDFPNLHKRIKREQFYAK